MKGTLKNIRDYNYYVLNKALKLCKTQAREMLIQKLFKQGFCDSKAFKKIAELVIEHPNEEIINWLVRYPKSAYLLSQNDILNILLITDKETLQDYRKVHGLLSVWGINREIMDAVLELVMETGSIEYRQLIVSNVSQFAQATSVGEVNKIAAMYAEEYDGKQKKMDF